MTIKQYIKKNGWRIDCQTQFCRVMVVDVVFASDINDLDETQFTIKAYDVEELSNLFKLFCKENNYKNNTVQNVVVVEMAETINDLKF